MKEFVRTLKQVYLVDRKDMLFYAIYGLAGGIFGMLVMLVLQAVLDDNEGYFQLGALLTLMMGLIVFVFGGAFTVASDFNLAISMGKTRKHYVPAKYLTMVLEVAILIAIAGGVGLVETVVYGAVCPNVNSELSVTSFLLRPQVILCMVLGVSMLTLLMGALVMRFAGKALWVLWALWMLLGVGSSKIIEALSGSGILDGLFRLTATQVEALILGVSALGVAASFALLRRQHVTA